MSPDVISLIINYNKFMDVLFFIIDHILVLDYCLLIYIIYNIKYAHKERKAQYGFFNKNL